MAQDEKGFTKLQWFLIITASIIVTSVFIYFILSMVGIDPWKKGKEVASSVPLISKYIKQEDENEIDLLKRQFEQEKVKLTKTIEEQAQMIKVLERDLQVKEEEVHYLTEEVRSLQSELTAITEEKNATVDIKVVYSNMNPTKAAESIAVLPEADAIEILSSLKQDIVARILEKMEPQERARMTELLHEENKRG